MSLCRFYYHERENSFGRQKKREDSLLQSGKSNENWQLCVKKEGVTMNSRRLL